MNSSTNYCGAIVLMGVSGCGKSTVGRLLATQLGCSFIEGDSLHSASSVAKMKVGIPLQDEDRWPWLDRIGIAMQANVEKDGVVVASCSALKSRYRDRLAGAMSGRLSFVFLDASRAVLQARLATRADHFMPGGMLDTQLNTLERPTSSENALTLTAISPPAELCESIRKWLAARAAR